MGGKLIWDWQVTCLVEDDAAHVEHGQRNSLSLLNPIVEDDKNKPTAPSVFSTTTSSIGNESVEKQIETWRRQRSPTVILHALPFLEGSQLGS